MKYRNGVLRIVVYGIGLCLMFGAWMVVKMLRVPRSIRKAIQKGDAIIGVSWEEKRR